MKHLTSADNPFFKDLKKFVSSSQYRRKAGQALLDGIHLVQSALDNGNVPLHLLVTDAAEQNQEVAGLLKKLPDVPRTRLKENLFAQLSELKSPSGLLALIAQPQPQAQFKVSAAHSKFCLLLEDIQDPGNVGSIFRSAAAAGCDAVFLSPGCADAWSPKVLRAGMGGHFSLNIHESVDLIAVAKAFEGRIFATSLKASKNLFKCDLNGRIAFAAGNEGAGLSAQLLAAAAQNLKIPMQGKMESLNVAASIAICLFESVRQRTQ